MSHKLTKYENPLRRGECPGTTFCLIRLSTCHATIGQHMVVNTWCSVIGQLIQRIYGNIINVLVVDVLASHFTLIRKHCYQTIFPASTLSMNSKKYSVQVSPIGQQTAPALVATYDWIDALFRCQTQTMSDFKRNHLWGNSYSLSRISRRESLCSGLKLAVEYRHGFRPLFFYLVIR